MEQKPKETVANETAGDAEFTIDCNIPINPIEAEGRTSVAPSGFCVSTSSDWPGSSTLTNLDTAKRHGSNRGAMSLADSTPTLMSPYSMNDAGFTVEKVAARNYGCRNACVAGCSSTKEEIKHEGRWPRPLEFASEDLMSKDKGSLELSLREDFRRVLSTFQDTRNLSRNESNMDCSRIPNNMAGGPGSSISNNGPLGGLPSKTLFSSSTTSTHATEGPCSIIPSNRPFGGSFAPNFSRFFLGRSLKTTTKGVLHENPEASDESRTRQHKTCSTPMASIENMQGYLSGEASDALMNRNSPSTQLHSQEIVREEPGLPHCGINLREWLESEGANASKNERLCSFRQIVQTVDDAHSQGIALMELRPSSFILFETGDVKYIGSLMEIELWSVNQDNTRKRGLEPEISARDNFRVKMQNLGEDKFLRLETRSLSRFDKDKATNQFSPCIIDMKKNFHSIWNAQNFSIYEGTSSRKSWLTSDNAQLEKKWYAFPEGFKIKDLLSLNIYSLGLLLFEPCWTCTIGSFLHVFFLKVRWKLDFVFWLLHPEPSSRPTTREILQSELIYGSDDTNVSNDEALCADMVDDAESDLLLHFLVTLKQHMQNKASSLLKSMECLDVDIKVVESSQACIKSLDIRGGGYDSNQKDHRGAESPCATSRMNVLKDKLFGNISELENVYFSMRSNAQFNEMPDIDRSDKDILRKRERLSWVQTPHNLPSTEEKSVDRVEIFFDGICKFARYNKFEVCGTLRNDDILNSNNVICSLSFDREEEYIGAAGVSKKIKIFEFGTLLDDYVDVQYPVLEMSNKSKFSCICWNNYIKNYLASTDYDGIVQMWDVTTGKGFAQYNEHQKRAWSVDFSGVDPTKFASGGDDCSLRIWSINERNSIDTIWNPANICCVQFSSYSSHLLAFGSANYRIYCYDLRHTRIPWCTLTGHENAVSYVRFLDSDTLVSASTDNTLKLWELKKTSLEGLSPGACSLTFSGHTNEKNFVGLGVLDGYIACGSETNEVYAYYRSLPMPITSHKFGCLDPLSGGEITDGNGHFVSSVCWRRKTQMLAVANSSGSIKILRMA